MTYFKRFESVRWIKIPTTNSKEEYDLKCPEHVWNVLWSQSSLFLLFVLFVRYCAGSQQGSVLYPSVRAYDGICHTVTWLHKQLLSWLEPVNVYICVCPVRDSLLDESELTSLRSPALCTLSFPAHSDEILRRFGSRRKTATQWCLPTHKAQLYSGLQWHLDWGLHKKKPVFCCVALFYPIIQQVDKERVKEIEKEMERHTSSQGKLSCLIQLVLDVILH